MSLCDSCNSIFTSLLSFTYDPKNPHDSRDPIYEHQLIRDIKDSADAGCALCKILIYNIHLPKDGRLDEAGKLKIKHARRHFNTKIPPGISLRLQNTLIGRLSYYVVPPEWCTLQYFSIHAATAHADSN
jgi:hypothetical protein